VRELIHAQVRELIPAQVRELIPAQVRELIHAPWPIGLAPWLPPITGPAADQINEELLAWCIPWTR
jgi:hypothetical protein